eukprot:921282-Pelagomonas_calceolata.AAC.1
MAKHSLMTNAATSSAVWLPLAMHKIRLHFLHLKYLAATSPPTAQPFPVRGPMEPPKTPVEEALCGGP